MTHEDEQFARTLAARAEAAAPRIRVAQDPVFRIARRRTLAARGAAALVTTAVLAGGGWAVAQGPWAAAPLVVQPGSAVPRSAEPSPAPSDASEGLPAIDAKVPADVTVSRLGEVAAGEPAEGWADMPYWRSGFLVRYKDTGSTERTMWRDIYTGHDRTGALVSVNDEDGMTVNPLDGLFGTTRSWAQAWAMPADPAALRASIETTIGESDAQIATLDANVWRIAGERLTDLPLPPTTREALWTVVVGVQGVTVDEGTDSLGRPGLVATFTAAGSLEGDGGTRDPWQGTRYVYDPVSRRVLETVDLTLGERTTTYLVAEPAEALPAEHATTIDGAVDLQRRQEADAAGASVLVGTGELVGLPQAEAVSRLADAGLSAEVRVEASPGAAPGTVWKAETANGIPSADALLPEVGTMIVWVTPED